MSTVPGKDFQYDESQKTCICPNGQRLKLSSAHVVIRGRRGVSFEGTPAICGNCPIKAKCMRKPDVSPYRQVTFFDGRKAHDTHPNTTAMKARIDMSETVEITQRFRPSSPGPFALIGDAQFIVEGKVLKQESAATLLNPVISAARFTPELQTVP